MPAPKRVEPHGGSFWHPKIEIRSIRRIRRAKRNARTHSKKQLEKLVAIIRRFGFINPIIIDEDGTIVAGHLRSEAAQAMGMTHVPVIEISHLSEVEKRAFALAENRIALDSGWDRETLAFELGELAILLPEAEIELSVTGFDIAEIDLVIADHSEAPDVSAQDQPPAPGLSVSRLCDLWIMARHRLYCGDARNTAAYSALMRNETAAMAFTDPPFNVSVKTHARGRSADRFSEFPMASGEMSRDQYQAFLEQVTQRIADACEDGSIVYICVDWRHIQQLLEAGARVFELKNICVWVKSNGGQGSFYRSQHEMVCVFKCGTGPHINSFELGQHGRSRTNVWSYAGANSFGAERKDALALHPTVKPTRLVADAMLDCSRRGAIILDPFMGSGTTIIAAETVGRSAYGMELDPRYVDVAVRRWEKFTGRDAILESTGQTFSKVEAERNSSLKDRETPKRDRNSKRSNRRRARS